MVFKNLREEIDATLRRDPAARSRLEVVLCYPGFHAVLWHRLAHWSWQRGWTLLSFDYRLLPESSVDDILEDVRDAQAFIHQQLNSRLAELQLAPVDLSRVVAGGASAGGYLAFGGSLRHLGQGR